MHAMEEVLDEVAAIEKVLDYEGESLSDDVPDDVAMCLRADGSTAPCGPGNQVCPPGPFGRSAPQFHVRDASCGENDPNGPVYDPVHGVYHLHYQNHVGCRGGRTYGHAVSRDFTHWAHMPISIWNDRGHPKSEGRTLPAVAEMGFSDGRWFAPSAG